MECKNAGKYEERKKEAGNHKRPHNFSHGNEKGYSIVPDESEIKVQMPREFIKGQEPVNVIIKGEG